MPTLTKCLKNTSGFFCLMLLREDVTVNPLVYTDDSPFKKPLGNDTMTLILTWPTIPEGQVWGINVNGFV